MPVTLFISVSYSWVWVKRRIFRGLTPRITRPPARLSVHESCRVAGRVNAFVMPRRGSGVAGSRAPIPAARRESELFCDHVFPRTVLQREVGVHLLEAAVLLFERPQPLNVRGLHPALLRLPPVVGGLPDGVLAADARDGSPLLYLLEDGDDLMLTESALAH